MKITRRQLFYMGLATNFASFAVPNIVFAEATHRSHGSSLIGPLKYEEGFKKFGFANKDAPKGGVVRLSVNGSFDSFNPFIQKGDAASGAGFVFESLMLPALDAGSEDYGLLAEWVEYPEDSSWVRFRIRPHASWADGSPVTPADAVFSLNILKQKGAPFYGYYYRDVSEAKDEGDGVVFFHFAVSGNRELPHIMGQLPIFPKFWWQSQDRDFAESTLEIPLGSGPYLLSKFEAGRFVEYDRRSDYWGGDIAVSIGANNFDHIRYEYFRDETASLEAFKVGKVDFRAENSAKRWATGYDFPARRDGKVILEEIVLEGPKAVQTFVFNQRREQLADWRVRRALSLAFDFEWTNNTIFRGQYARPSSYFEGTSSLTAGPLPDPLEEELLRSLGSPLPEHTFDTLPTAPKTDASGHIRKQLRQATRLLKEAGWQIQDGALRNQSGEIFNVSFLSAQKTQAAVIDPFLRNLRQLGIKAERVLVDGPQYIKRVQEFDYDMIIGGIRNSESPGNEQRDYWSSAAADRIGSRNYAGVKDQLVDALIERIILAKDRQELEALTRALDRILRLGYHMVFELYTPFERIAYWSHLQRPRPGPSRSIGFPSYWWRKQL